MTALLRESCIAHPPLPFVAVRPEYLSITGDHCAAALLSIFEHWHNVKLEHADQSHIQNEISGQGGMPADQDESLWIYLRQEDMRGVTLGLFGEKRIHDALEDLQAWGYISTRHNPRFGWDRTIQYRLNVQAVQQAIDEWSASMALTGNPQFGGLQSADPRLPIRQTAQALPDHSPDHSSTDPNPSNLTNVRLEGAPPDQLAVNILQTYLNDLADDLAQPAPVQVLFDKDKLPPGYWASCTDDHRYVHYHVKGHQGFACKRGDVRGATPYNLYIPQHLGYCPDCVAVLNTPTPAPSPTFKPGDKVYYHRHGWGGGDETPAVAIVVSVGKKKLFIAVLDARAGVGPLPRYLSVDARNVKPRDTISKLEPSLEAAYQQRAKDPKPVERNVLLDSIALLCYGTLDAFKMPYVPGQMQKALTAIKAVSPDVTPVLIDEFRAWWGRHDFRGQKGQRPIPQQIPSAWLNFVGDTTHDRHEDGLDDVDADNAQRPSRWTGKGGIKSMFPLPGNGDDHRGSETPAGTPGPAGSGARKPGDPA